jgi:hypothetical protein
MLPIKVPVLWGWKQQLCLRSDAGEHSVDMNDLLVSARFRNSFTPTSCVVDVSVFLNFALPLPLVLLPLLFLDFGLDFDFLVPVSGLASASS